MARWCGIDNPTFFYLEKQWYDARRKKQGKERKRLHAYNFFAKDIFDVKGCVVVIILNWSNWYEHRKVSLTSWYKRERECLLLCLLIRQQSMVGLFWGGKLVDVF